MSNLVHIKEYYNYYVISKCAILLGFCLEIIKKSTNVGAERGAATRRGVAYDHSYCDKY